MTCTARHYLLFSAHTEFGLLCYILLTRCALWLWPDHLFFIAILGKRLCASLSDPRWPVKSRSQLLFQFTVAKNAHIGLTPTASLLGQSEFTQWRQQRAFLHSFRICTACTHFQRISSLFAHLLVLDLGPKSWGFQHLGTGSRILITASRIHPTDQKYVFC